MHTHTVPHIHVFVCDFTRCTPSGDVAHHITSKICYTYRRHFAIGFSVRDPRRTAVSVSGARLSLRCAALPVFFTFL